MKQVIIGVEAFATVTVADNWDGNVDEIPMKLDVYDSCDHDDSQVIHVEETDITTKTLISVVDITTGVHKR